MRNRFLAALTTPFQLAACAVLACSIVLGSASQAQPAAGPDQAAIDRRPLGTNANPVRCQGPRGERYYLARLVDPDGAEIDFERIGSFGAGPYGNILDGYSVKLGDKTVTVFMDMYHDGFFEDRPLPGFYLRCRYTWDLVIRDDGLRYAIGADEPYDGVLEVTDPETKAKVMTVTLKEGLMDGPMIAFTPAGEKKHEVPFVAGKEHGTATYYHPDGAVASKREYKEGQQHGQATWYYPDGTVQMKGQYENDLGTGLWQAFHPNGKIRLAGKYADSKREGEWTTYSEDGEVELVEWYRAGEVIDPPANQPD